MAAAAKYLLSSTQLANLLADVQTVDDGDGDGVCEKSDGRKEWHAILNHLKFLKVCPYDGCKEEVDKVKTCGKRHMCCGTLPRKCANPTHKPFWPWNGVPIEDEKEYATLEPCTRYPLLYLGEDLHRLYVQNKIANQLNYSAEKVKQLKARITQLRSLTREALRGVVAADKKATGPKRRRKTEAERLGAKRTSKA